MKMNIKLQDRTAKLKQVKTVCRCEIKGSRSVFATLIAGMVGVAGSLFGAEPQERAVDSLSERHLQVLKMNPVGYWPADAKGGRERGKDYNHSTFCDLVITGLCGLRPRADDIIEVNPLVPENAWDWFCLDRIPYHDSLITIIWDRTGERYGRGKGLSVYRDNERIETYQSTTRQ